MADTQNFEINMPRIGAGMRRMNQMKDEIRSMIELLAPHLENMIHSAMRNHHGSYPGEYTDVLRIADGERGSTLSLQARLVMHPISMVHMRLNYTDLNGDETPLLLGYRELNGGRGNYSCTPKQLVKENVADCYHAIEELMKHVTELYPDEMKMELDLYTSLVP